MVCGDMVCGPSCNFKIAFIHWDVFNFTFHHLTSKAYHCCMRLKHLLSLKFVWLLIIYSSDFFVDLWTLTFDRLLQVSCMWYFVGTTSLPSLETVWPSVYQLWCILYPDDLDLRPSELKINSSINSICMNLNFLCVIKSILCVISFLN